MKRIKTIKIDADKCIGCRTCEAICAAFHAEPKYSGINPRRSRIRVFMDEGNNVFVPIIAGPYTDAECNSRNIMVINSKEYGECTFCRASCPSRDRFKEPDTGIPLKCDMCGEPSPAEPMCVKYCSNKALTFVEREEEEEEEVKKHGPNFIVTAYDVEAEDIRKALHDAEVKVRSVKAI